GGESTAISLFEFLLIRYGFMGGCLSCPEIRPAAMLILDDGSLREFVEPVKVAEIVREIPDLFVCHSDRMAFDEYLSPLPADVELQVGQIYFLLPLIKSRYPLPASDMAALAVKAAAAMQTRQKKKKKWRRCKISPMVEHHVSEEIDH
ncbi:hypothetical protein KI387_033621, partial [Taxus chinensis]